MDKVRAKRMSGELIGKTIGHWRIDEYINCGKSALVFKGARDATEGAIKIFDPELVERYGDTTQLTRIEREKSLIGHSHPNLVQILDGGQDKIEDTTYLYLVMEYYNCQNLADQLDKISYGSIWSIISQLAEAAKFLESLGLNHRDIKPENIAFDPYNDIVKLLDMGVLRPVADSTLTDENAKVFVGTTRYASPEFLLRQEKDTADGWKAVTFYQLGGVLHDLIMRIPLFQSSSEPYAQLILAVISERPTIVSDKVSPDLVELARNCLVKDPNLRLRLVDWHRFTAPAPGVEPFQLVKERIANRCVQAKGEASFSKEEVEQDNLRGLQQHAATVRNLVRDECRGNKLFPRHTLPDPQLRTNAVRLAVSFDASPSMHALYVKLELILDLGWLEPAEDILSIKLRAIASKDGVSSDEECGQECTIYEGSCLQEKVSAAVIPFLYRALDAAQSLGSSPPDGMIVFGADKLSLM